TLLPDKLSIDGHIEPQQRGRGVFSCNVYTATLDVTAEFTTRALRELAADNPQADWSAARLEIGLSRAHSVEGDGVDIGGEKADWASATGNGLSSLKATIASAALTERETIPVRFRITLAGSGKLA